MNTLKYFKEKFSQDKIRSYTFIPFTREEMAFVFKELGFNVGAEIGVFLGKYSEELCLANPNLKLFSIDAWKVYDKYTDYTEQSYLDNCYKDAVEKLSKYNCEVIRDWSESAAENFADGSLDFIYIDGNHSFEGTTNDINAWSRKVRKGGIIFGDDYINYIYEDGEKEINWRVKDAVDNWARKHNISLFILSNENWMWIK